MNNYKLWTKDQLANKIMSYGDNPYGMTKAQMVEYIEGTEKAQTMTDEELIAHIRARGGFYGAGE